MRVVNGHLMLHICVSCHPYIDKYTFLKLPDNIFSVLDVSVNIHISNGRQGTFKVICTSSGGRPLSMTVTGPSGVPQDITESMVVVGEREGTGNDTFSAEIMLQGGRNGDSYTCYSSNVVSHSSNNSTLLG